MKHFARFRTVLFFVSQMMLAGALACAFWLEAPLEQVTRYDASDIVLDRGGMFLNASLSAGGEWCIPVSLDRMGKWTSPVVVSIEDKRFYGHGGVDLLAVLRAGFYNLRSGKIVSGASTITTQLIRISYPRPRTFHTKLLEFWAAIRIESKLGKDEILELYLNKAPFGGNVRGVEAAARIYFNKDAASLSLAESTLLISLLRSPSFLRPDRHVERTRSARDKNLTRLWERDIITREQMEFGMVEPIPERRHPMPRLAAMASRHVRQASAGEIIHRSTLDSRSQTLLEESLRRALAPDGPMVTAAGAILENESGAVLAYVGNARHGMPYSGAQVDCGASPRSPGSTLKPFVYAAAFDRGLLTPASLLADTPLAFRGASPRNYDLSYRGPVSARFALAQSLNAPAVRVLRMLGYADVAKFFRDLGFSYIDKGGSHYADSLILGGCEVSLLQLAEAYAGLSGAPALRWLAGGELGRSHAISPAACWLVTDILADAKRLPILFRDLADRRNLRIAFKTGTSHGMRDAWCAGYTPEYTVVIWFGRSDGGADSTLVGLEKASPVLFELLSSLPNTGGRFRSTPESIYKRNVCALSGMLPGRYCPRQTQDEAIRDVSSMALCTLHRIENGQGVVDWPAELSHWMQMSGRVTAAVSTIHITEPRPGRRYLTSGSETVRVRFAAEGGLPHYWYLDGSYVGQDIDGSGFFYDVPLGRHKLTVLSAEESETAHFEVADPAALSPWGDYQLLE